MSKNPLRLKIAYLYPDFLQGFCDKANLDVFKIRAKARNINVEIEEIKNDDKINSLKYDFYYISGSNTEALSVTNKHLKNNYSQLLIAAEDNTPMLAIHCGYILFGKEFQLNNSPLRKTIGIFDASTKMMQNNEFCKVSGEFDILKNNIAGYVNHNTETILGEDAKPFLNMKKGKTEGCIYKNAIGTYITSPLLAQNPHLCDLLISQCLQNRYKCQIPLAKLMDDIEWYSHNYILEAK